MATVATSDTTVMSQTSSQGHQLPITTGQRQSRISLKASGKRVGTYVDQLVTDGRGNAGEFDGVDSGDRRCEVAEL